VKDQVVLRLPEVTRIDTLLYQLKLRSHTDVPVPPVTAPNVLTPPPDNSSKQPAHGPVPCKSPVKSRALLGERVAGGGARRQRGREVYIMDRETKAFCALSPRPHASAGSRPRALWQPATVALSKARPSAAWTCRAG